MKVRCPYCGDELYAIRTRITLHAIKGFSRREDGVPQCIVGTEQKHDRTDEVAELYCYTCQSTFLQEGWDVEFPEIAKIN